MSASGASGPAVVELTAGDLDLAVQGGAHLTICSLRHRGDELLVAPQDVPEQYRVHRRRTGITFLHPWANRVGADRFGAVDLTAAGAALSRDPNGVAIHGLAVPGTWAPAADGDTIARVHAAFAATPAFPWAHAVDVTIELDERLTVTTTVTATGGEPVPVAHGWHPYFALPGTARSEWRLSLPAARKLVLDDLGIPTGATVAAPADDAPLGSRTFDDGFGELGERPRLTVGDATRAVTVTHDGGFPLAQVFAPGDADVVSLEPMAAPSDALRSGRGLRHAAPGRSDTAVFAVAVAAL